MVSAWDGHECECERSKVYIVYADPKQYADSVGVSMRYLLLAVKPITLVEDRPVERPSK